VTLPEPLDLQGQTFLITGANTGIGETAAYQLAARGASLLLACRNPAKAAPVLEKIARDFPAATAECVALDLSSLDSVRACAAQLQARNQLNCLVLNAGVGGQRGITTDGFELHFGTNHLGHYLLTRLLIDRLAPTTTATSFVAPRIVIVASNSHKQARALDLTTVQHTTASYSGMPEYAVSKLCNILFMRELDRRIAARASTTATPNTTIHTYGLNPGRVATDVWRRIPAPFRWLFKQTMITADVGGSYIVKCAAGSEFAAHSGRYYSRGAEFQPSALATNDALANELWQRSAQWVGLPETGLNAAGQ
jgi:retinol dehydrogenase 12